MTSNGTTVKATAVPFCGESVGLWRTGSEMSFVWLGWMSALASQSCAPAACGLLSPAPASPGDPSHGGPGCSAGAVRPKCRCRALLQGSCVRKYLGGSIWWQLLSTVSHYIAVWICQCTGRWLPTGIIVGRALGNCRCNVITWRMTERADSSVSVGVNTSLSLWFVWQCSDERHILDYLKSAALP